MWYHHVLVHISHHINLKYKKVICSGVWCWRTYHSNNLWFHIFIILLNIIFGLCWVHFTGFPHLYEARRMLTMTLMMCTPRRCTKWIKISFYYCLYSYWDSMLMKLNILCVCFCNFSMFSVFHNFSQSLFLLHIFCCLSSYVIWKFEGN